MIRRNDWAHAVLTRFLLSCDFGRPDEPEGLSKSEPSWLQDLLFEMLSVPAIASSHPKTWTLKLCARRDIKHALMTRGKLSVMISCFVFFLA